jgi:hypothetical protein
MSGLIGIGTSLITAPLSIGTNLLGGVLGSGGSGGLLGGLLGGGSNPLSAITGMLGSGFTSMIMPLVLLFVGVEVFLKLV